MLRADCVDHFATSKMDESISSTFFFFLKEYGGLINENGKFMLRIEIQALPAFQNFPMCNFTFWKTYISTCFH